MKATRKTLKHKGREILKAKSSFQFPDGFDIMDYQMSMIKQLNYYNVEVDPKKKQQWAITFWKKQGKDVSGFQSVDPYIFSQVGALLHMKEERGLMISKPHLEYINDQYKKVKEFAKAFIQPKKEEVKDTVSVQDRIEQLASNHIGEIEGMIDDAVFNNDSFRRTDMTKVDVLEYLAMNAVKAPAAKLIQDHFKTRLESLQDNLKEEEHGYVKKVAKVASRVLEDVVSQCSKAVAISKAVRAPRKRKEVPPAKLVSKLKYMRSDDTLKMVSVNPEKIIGASEAWIVDTQRRRLVKYEALDGMTLSVKGTTILNWDPLKSGSKILRKPDQQLKGVADMTKRPLAKLYSDIKGAVAKVKGRTNEGMLIVKVF